MKIAYIYDAIYPWTKGGVERRVYEVGKRLSERGYEIHWFGIGWWLNENPKPSIKYDGITLHGVCEPMQLYIKGKRSVKEAIYFAAKLLPSLSKKRFDIIDCQEFPYFPCFISKFYSMLKDSKFIITWHEIWDKYWFEYFGKKGFFGWVIERIATKLTDKNVAVSEKTKRDLENLGIKNIDVIYNGIDFKKMNEVKPSKEESDIIFTGRLIKEKNVDILLKAVSILKNDIPDIKCIIIGDGPEKNKLIKLSKKLDIKKNVKFIGFLERYDDVVAYMKSSKVFVLPSTREGFGIVVLEANACGLPVITTHHNRNAAVDLIKKGTGFKCAPSAKDFADKITIAFEKRKKIKRKCINVAKQYDWDNITDIVEKFYIN